MNRTLGLGSAMMLAGLLLSSSAFAQVYDLATADAVSAATRGSGSNDGVSLGSFTSAVTLTNGTGTFSFSGEGVVTTGAFSGLNFSFTNIFSSGNAVAAFNYPNGTGGTAQSPLVMRMDLPGAVGSAPVLYNLNGSLGLSLTVTLTTDPADPYQRTIRFSSGASSPDPQGSATDQVTTAGVLQTSETAFSVSDSFALRSSLLVITGRASVGASWTSPQFPSPPASLAIGTLSITPDGTVPVVIPTALTDGVTAGSLAVATGGGPPVVLTGANTYTGGTTINPGATLQIGNGGPAGSIVGNVVDNGALVFDRTGSLTFGGAIAGSGSLTQAGAGTLILTGVNTYTGGTQVAEGATLIVGQGGQLGSGGTTVSPGGVLVITPGGQIGSGAFNNTGTLVLAAPQSILGDYTQSGGATLILTAAPGNSGALLVTGSADLTNANLVFSAANGYVPFGTYTLVSAAKAGTSFAGTSVTVNVPANDLYEVVAVDPPTTESLLLLAQPAPTIYADTLVAQRRDFLSVSDSVAARMETLRGAPGAAGDHAVTAQGLSVWAAAHGDYSHTSGAGGAQGFDSTAGGGVLGLDARISPLVQAGVALAVSDEAISGGTGTSYQGQTGQLRLYATARQGRAFIDGEIGGAINGGTVKRSIPDSSPQAVGDLAGRGLGGSVRGGLRYSVAGWGLEPSITLGAMGFAQNPISEGGGGPFDLAVSRGSLSSVYTLAGVETDHVLALRGHDALQVAARLGWLHELAATDAGLDASFNGPAVGFASAPFGRDAANVALQAELLTGSAFTMFARYETYLASRSDSQTLETGLTYRW